MDNSNNSTVIEEDTCPSPGGLKSAYGFTPGFKFHDLIAHPSQNWHLWGWLVCLVLLAITWIVALVTIVRHIRNYYDPTIQRHKLRVLLYPPVYATLAWFSYLRYDYSTTIMFFATLFEALAIYNLFTCLEAYLQPYRDEAEGTKEPVHTKVFGLFNVNLKSKFGFHFRTIITIMVLQYPVWAIADALISIITSVKGYYCGESYSFQGAYVYLTIINFILLSLILSALFTYLAVFHNEWKRGQISAHGMFWCVKGPVMAIFYFGDILLSILKTCNVIKGTDGTQSSDGLAWPASAVKNGLYVIIICATMTVASILMLRFFGPQDQIRNKGSKQRITGWKAFVDAYITYIPEFFRNILCCGIDSYRLARKRAELRKRTTP
ncbi:organic solute transporter Ostalpha-domain-containing protein [Phascolomyces articulosus]|uniref:Organic solute transporter Ostalpha-domain-containing protein n=1 Tax=Phascolomyces articulosus TaxID=60185 RepID=A0AAD5K5L1_9FUNG|nr:organic solute transporter Ostalpha-domain-containing protein [Phascolomyces articulosus]